MRTQASAQAFAQWLGEVHPELYSALFAQAISQGANSRARLGDYDFSTFSEPVLQDIQIDTGALNELADTSFSTAADAISDAISSLPSSQSITKTNVTPSSQGGGFASSVTTAIGNVGQWITSKQGLTSLSNLGTAVLGAVTSANVAKAQMTVIQQQAARSQAGLSPAPITYSRDVNGNLVPVYDTGTGEQMPASLLAAIQNGTAHRVVLPDGSIGYTLNSNTLSSVLSAGIPWYVWVALAGVALIAFT